MASPTALIDQPSQPGHSLYQARLGAGQQAGYLALEGEAQTNTCIIGGGFAGLATAASLLEKGSRDLILLEAEGIGHGASGRNGGFVFGGFSLDAAQLLQQLGRAPARELYALTLQAVQKIRGRISQYGIDCEPVYEGVILANWFRDPAPLLALQRFMADQLDVHWEWMSGEQTRATLLSERYHSALLERDAFHFNPLAYATGLARRLSKDGARIFEHSRAEKVERLGGEWQVSCANGGSIRCRHLVVCCGGYYRGFFPALARATLPIATYAIATEPLGPRLQDVLRTRAAVYDTRFAFDYYRPLADTRLLWGGRISTVDRSPAAVARLLKADLLKVYPQLAEVAVSHAWSGLMGYARHKMPQIGRLPSGAWYAMGFGGHGVAPTTVAGEVLADCIVQGAGIPAGFRHFGLPPTFGLAGKTAAQASYWWLQARDVLRAMR
ncbi:MAG: FAD-binding oxidoreductase [Pseudomonadota bacterium]